MKIRAGFEIAFDCAQRTPILLMLNVHPSRQPDLLTSDAISVDPGAALTSYLDLFGNRVTRTTMEPGRTTFRSDFTILDSGLHDEVNLGAQQLPVEALPDDVLVFLLASRYCDTEHLSDLAWNQFGSVPAGWARVQAICDYVHNRISFGYAHARATRTASEGHAEQIGVCRDFAHLAVTLCRCMNIPARYCTGYLGDIGVPAVPDPMDFSAWFEVYLDGRWYTFDARHNVPRIGRVVVARGRDAADVAISTSFGFARLACFNVVTDEVVEGGPVLSTSRPAAPETRQQSLAASSMQRHGRPAA